MAASQAADTRCPVCAHVYNSLKYIPKILPCEHTACERCLVSNCKHDSMHIKCPLCSCVIQKSTVSYLQTNVTALGVKNSAEIQPSYGYQSRTGGQTSSRDVDGSCPVCKEVYDSQQIIPKVLPCSHTACQSCLSSISIGLTIKCPVCFHYTKVSFLETNLSVLQQLHDKPSYGYQSKTGDTSNTFAFLNNYAGAQLFGQRDGQEPGGDASHKYNPYYESTLTLPGVIEIKTGFDDEKELYKQRCHLYRFDEENHQWKERGVGDVKLMRHTATGRVRVVMRRDQVHKLCANHTITPAMQLKALETSDRAWVYNAIDFSEGDASPELLAIRFKNPDIALEFKARFEECQRDIVQLLPVKQEVKVEEKPKEIQLRGKKKSKKELQDAKLKITQLKEKECYYRKILLQELVRLPDAYFDFKSKYNKCYCKTCHEARNEYHYHKEGEGDRIYTKPIGWSRVMLHLHPRAKTLDIFDKWNVAYHGTTSSAIKAILDSGMLLLPGDKTIHGGEIKECKGHFNEENKPAGFNTGQIFVSPSMKYAGCEVYSKKERMDLTSHGPVDVRFAFQVRIHPGHFSIGPQTIGRYDQIDPPISNDEIEWSTTTRDAVIPVALLVNVSPP